VAFEIARRHSFEEEMASLPDGVELHLLPSGAAPPALSVRYRRTSGVAQRIEDAHRASSEYLDALAQ
jgi:NTE family protein